MQPERFQPVYLQRKSFQKVPKSENRHLFDPAGWEISNGLKSNFLFRSVLNNSDISTS